MFIELFFSRALLAGPIMLVISGFTILVGTFGPNSINKTWPQSKLSFKFMFIDKTCRGVNMHLIINPCILWIIFMHYREGKWSALYVDGVEYRIKRHIVDSSVLSMCQFICLASNGSSVNLSPAFSWYDLTLCTSAVQRQFSPAADPRQISTGAVASNLMSFSSRCHSPHFHRIGPVGFVFMSRGVAHEPDSASATRAAN